MLNKILDDFKRIIVKLEEVLKLEKTDIIRDSAVKRFELCFDLAWKAIKVFAQESGITCFSPKECFKTAFQLKLIDYEEKWLEMIADRNLFVHLYKEETVDKLYSKLFEYAKMFKDLLTKLEEKEKG